MPLSEPALREDIVRKRCYFLLDGIGVAVATVSRGRPLSIGCRLGAGSDVIWRSA